MSEIYKAWDNNEYPSPPPADWYQAPDGLWWPEGYGPGPAPEEPAVVAPPEPLVPPSRPTPSADSYTPPVAAPGVGAMPPPGAPEVIPPAFSQPMPGAETGEKFGGQPLGGATFAQGAPVGSETSSNRALPIVLLGLAMAIALVAIPLGIYVVRDSDDAPIGGAVSVTTLPAGSGPGSLNDPWVVGDPVAIFYDDTDAGTEYRWTVSATGGAGDSTTTVLETNDFNDDPPEGEIYVVIPLSLTYKSGPDQATISDLSFKAVGQSGAVYTTQGNYCGALPDVLATTAQVSPGTTVIGNICWAIQQSDLQSLKLVIQADGVAGAIYVDLKN